jgi:hypothetical protein
VQLGRWRFIAATTAVALCSFGLTATAASAADFTWTGATPTLTPEAANWSKGTNWEGAVALSNPIGTLTFPALTGLSCTTQPPTSTCYSSHNDISGLSVGAISIDNGHNYFLDGEPITLGAGGITASTSASTFGSVASLAMPITLGAAQTWAVDGHNVSAQLGIHGEVSGASALSVNLSNGAVFWVYSDDMEVGAITVSSSGSGFPSVDIGTTAGPGSLNGNNHSLVTLGDGVSLYAFGDGSKIGPLTIGANSLFQVGSGLNNGGISGHESGAGTLAVDSGVTLHSTNSYLTSINESGTTVGESYSQLHATGPVNLGGAELSVADGESTGGACEEPTLGEVDTLIITTGAITGTFNGVPDGKKIPLQCFGSGSAPGAVIHYTEHTVTATISTPPPPPSLTTTALQVSNAAPAIGESVTYTATVTPETLGEASPSGPVMFLDGGVPIGTCEEQPLTQGASSSTATCTVSYSAVGTHAIEAFYFGNAEYEESGSPEVTVTVHASSTGGGGSTSGGGSTPTPPLTSTPPVQKPKPLTCKKGFKKKKVRGKFRCVKIKHKHHKKH